MLANYISRATVCLLGCLTVLAGLNPTAADVPATKADFAARAERAFRLAQTRYQTAPSDATAAWQFGRACFDSAGYATNNTRRASLAEQGMTACRLALARDSNSAPAHYYLGMNLGQLARTRGLSALRLVDQMEREFIRARELDKWLDWAGPDRNLGLLYRDAPAIGSVGSRTRAREHLRRAVEVAPAYPENRLNLIEAYVQWSDPTAAGHELQKLEAAWSTARTNFAGEAWVASWADWESRLKKLKNKLDRARPAPP